jgi:hypothetical protein
MGVARMPTEEEKEREVVMDPAVTVRSDSKFVDRSAKNATL